MSEALAKPRIVCAANQLPDGTLLVGPRHWGPTMRQQADTYKKAHGISEKRLAVAKQGFIDQFGKFYSREEAWKIAEANGQIIRDHDKCVGELFSEHLY